MKIHRPASRAPGFAVGHFNALRRRHERRWQRSEILAKQTNIMGWYSDADTRWPCASGPRA